MGHHDVFISYARSDREKVEKIAKALSQAGLHVWWDPQIKTGAGFRNEITDALTNTRSVLVVWSRNSVGSRFVCDEADEGAARGILYPALMDNVDIPLGFRQIQTADLTHWRGNLNDPALNAFVQTVASNISPTRHSKRPQPTPAPSPDPKPAKAKKPTKPEKPAKKAKKEPKPREPKPQKVAKAAYTTTGSRRRFTLIMQAIFMASMIAAAFGALAYTSDFVFSAYRPFFIGGMGILAFLSRYGTLEADRAAGAASLALVPRSFIALIFFSMIAIAPVIMEGRIYAAALEGVQVKGIEGADINSVALEQNGKRLLTASDDGTVKVWDANTGVELGEYKGHENWVWGADFSPDGKYAASASRDLTVKIWRVSNPSVAINATGHRASVYDVAWHPGGEVVASGAGDQTVILWDPTTGDAIRTLRGHNDDVTAIDFSPDGNSLASTSKDGVVRIWDWRTGARLGTMSTGGQANDVKFSKNGQMIATANDAGKIRIWETTGQQITTIDHGVRAFALAFINNDKTIATSGVNPEIRLWNVETQNLQSELTAHKDGSRGLDSSRDGSILVSGSRDNTARVWDVPTRNELATVGHIKSAIDLPFAIDTPPVFVTSQAPVPFDFPSEPLRGVELLGKGIAVAAAITAIALLIKGLLWILRLRTFARPAVVTTLLGVTAYLGVLIASALPVEALSLWATAAFIPAAAFALLRWAWRSLILRHFTKRRGKHAY